MTVRAVLSPIATGAGRRDDLIAHLSGSVTDIFDTLRPSAPDFGAALGAALTTDGGVLIGTGEPMFDSRLAAAAGVGHFLVAGGEQDHLQLQQVSGQLVRSGRTPRGISVLDHPDASSSALEAEGSAVPFVAVTAGLDAEPGTPVIGPESFERNLIIQARAAKAHIVLPEGDDDRILEAADQLLAARVCDLTILGDPATMAARAHELGLDLSSATLTDPTKGSDLERFAEEFAELRKAKGVSLDEARETMKDISYYATMMIHLGMADGMVSGAAHTTAHTIKPSFQIIKTSPDASIVSSIFLMVMDGVLWAFGDCAVNPNPTPEQLAEIAVVSAKTAAQFGIEPKVAMLSYSTGASGAGEDVEAVAEGVKIAQESAPNLEIDGPLQFDAAVVESVGQKKMPGSEVAGKATVFVFPDLNAGNITYKAVQRTADALAVGPILQGLNKPVNDLSRGATVPDIVNTVAITAIQAGN
ncbi:MAG: phosphate acetyltransferase [Corynebacterium sp.]|uniref:phosphate acetyltransferase n=2 Tax=Corynebacteriaceae TaxID=1653 RepID=UPI0026496164|nr:phosphate acetyltransferase [Corynebacterium sp.]MDN5721581.1 phosphate acetyltransferase [Corynebacterium sp.]MDN6282005.1 phosphate acetyltransferase [Corynebacterium sp.]MDN6304408.1 phosphate acetyltransferase [Corynebacterium sp.]MDN6352005.1 phosphate acetyltransferase [Corynebacterium sp.]MDN6366496.1 phosphate acetyltransferase [Corynebacterium sp.]